MIWTNIRKKIYFNFYFIDYFQMSEHINGALFSVSQNMEENIFWSDDNLGYSLCVLLVYPSGQISWSEQLWDAKFVYWMCIVEKMELATSSSS